MLLIDFISQENNEKIIQKDYDQISLQKFFNNIINIFNTNFILSLKKAYDLIKNNNVKFFVIKKGDMEYEFTYYHKKFKLKSFTMYKKNYNYNFFYLIVSFVIENYCSNMNNLTYENFLEFLIKQGLVKKDKEFHQDKLKALDIPPYILITSNNIYSNLLKKIGDDSLIQEFRLINNNTLVTIKPSEELWALEQLIEQIIFDFMQNLQEIK